MRFCIKCGAQVSETDKFCQNCGTPVSEIPTPSPAGMQTPQGNNGGQQAAPQYQYQPGQQPYQPGQQPYQQSYQQYGQPAQAQTQTKKKFPVPIIIAAVAVIAIVVSLILILTGSGSLTMKGAVKTYYKALQKGDGKAYLEATCSPSMVKALEEETGKSKKTLISYLDMALAFTAEDGVKYKSISITDKEKADKDDVKDAIEEIKDETDVKVRISKMYEIEVEYKVWDPDYEEWDSDDETLIVYKSGIKWYVMPEDF